MISGLAGISKLKPAHAGQPMPGIQPLLLDADGREIQGNDVEGYLCIRHPWPSMLRTTFGDTTTLLYPAVVDEIIEGAKFVKVAQ